MTTKPTAIKKCTECGKDVTGLKRAKDESGRYFCEHCWMTRSADIATIDAEIIRIQTSLAGINKSSLSQDMVATLFWAAILAVDFAVCMVIEGSEPASAKTGSDVGNIEAALGIGCVSFLGPLVAARILWPMGNRAPALMAAGKKAIQKFVDVKDVYSRTAALSAIEGTRSPASSLAASRLSMERFPAASVAVSGLAFVLLLLPDVLTMPASFAHHGFPIPFAVGGMIPALIAALVAYPITAVWYRRWNAISSPIFSVLLLLFSILAVGASIGTAKNDRAAREAEFATQQRNEAARDQAQRATIERQKAHDCAVDILNDVARESTSLLKSALLPTPENPISGDSVDWQIIAAIKNGAGTEASNIKLLPTQFHDLYGGVGSAIAQSIASPRAKEILAEEMQAQRPKIDAEINRFCDTQLDADTAIDRFFDFLQVHKASVTAADGNLQFDSEEFLSQFNLLRKSFATTGSSAKSPKEFNDEINSDLTNILDGFDRDILSAKEDKSGKVLLTDLRTEAEELAVKGQIDRAIAKYQYILTVAEDYTEVDAKFIESVKAVCVNLQTTLDKQRATVVPQDPRPGSQATSQASASESANLTRTILAVSSARRSQRKLAGGLSYLVDFTKMPQTSSDATVMGSRK